MAKKVFYGDDARNRVIGGAKALYDAVKVTYSPKGGNVVLGRQYGGPAVTHDGVTVAEAIDLPENDDETLGYAVGARLIQQAASNLNKIAGDGTTTVTILTYHILKEAARLIAAGYNPQELRRGIEEAGAEVVAAVEKMAEKIEGKNDRVAEVATISAGDASIGNLIAEVVERIGKDGVVTVEPGQSLEIEAEITDGFTFDRGWVSPFFINDVGEQQALWDRPAFVITSKKLAAAQDLFPIIGKIIEAGKKEIVVIADHIEGDALNMLIVNKLKNAANVVAVKAPSFGDRRLAVLEDIATLTGSKLIGDDVTMDQVDLSYIGSARKVIVNKEDTTIVKSDDVAQEDIDTRIEQIRTQADNTKDEWEKKQLLSRAAALGGKVAVIKVGGATETEITEKKYRVDDAVAATKAALSEGIVAGGGVTLLNLSKGITGQDAGHNLLREALKQPFLHIMENSGLNGQALLAKVEESGKTGYGINVMGDDKMLIDLKKAGVIDPARVTKEVVQSAVSIASTAATMGALVVEIPEKPDMSGAQNVGY